jgi:hypothetical protein
MAEFKKNERESQRVAYSKFDLDIICAGILIFLKNPAQLDVLYHYIKPELMIYGDDSLQVRAIRFIYSHILDIRKTEGSSALTATHLESRLRSHIDSDDTKAAQALFTQILKDQKYHQKAEDSGCRQLFLDFLKSIKMFEWADDFGPKWKKGHVDLAVNTIDKLTSDLKKISYNNRETSIDFGSLEVSNIVDIVAESDDPRDQFDLGVPGLYNDIGPFTRGTLCLFVGSTGSGKSQMSHHIIRMAIQQRKYVHCAVLEDTLESFMRKEIASLTGIKVDRLREFKKPGKSITDKEKELIIQAKASLAEYVKVDLMYGMSTENIHQLKLEYDAERVAKGKEPYSIDIVDYTGHVADKSGNQSNQMYEKMRIAFGMRKDFCLLNGKTGFDFAQVNRPGETKKEAGFMLKLSDVAASFDILQVCDNVITINRSPDDKDDNNATLLVVKARDGVYKKNGYKVGTEFDRSRWDMNKHVNRSTGEIDDATPIGNSEIV